MRPLCQKFQDPIWTYYRKTPIPEIEISSLSAPPGDKKMVRGRRRAPSFCSASADDHGRFVSIPQELAFVQRRKDVLFECFSDHFADYCRLVR
jgi:hypothetical protein